MCPQSVRTSIQVISLRSSQQRRQLFTAHSATTTLPWSFFDAKRSLSPELSYSPQEATWKFGRPLTDSELGCYASHFEVWRDFLYNDFDQLIVFEDDVVVNWDIVNTLAASRYANSGVDVLRLFAVNVSPTELTRTAFLAPHIHLVRSRGLMLGMQGYLLTREAAKQLIKCSDPVIAPIDWVLGRYWLYGLPNFALFPFPLYERTLPSTIITSTKNTPRKLTARARLLNLLFRTRVRIARTAYELQHRRAHNVKLTQACMLGSQT